MSTMIPILVFLLVGGNWSQDFQKAEAYFQQGKYGEAEKIYRNLEKKLPEYRNEMAFRVLECELNQGNYERVIREAPKLLARVQGTYLEPEVQLLLGFATLLKGDLQRAESTFLALEQNPNYRGTPRVRLGQGLLYYRMNKLEEALEKLQGIEDPLAKVLLARIYNLTGHPLDALALYKELYPEFQGTQLDFLVIYGLIETLFNSGDYKGVVNEATSFLETHPANYPLRDHVQLYLGLAYYYLRDYTKALENFTDLLNRKNFEFAPYAAYFAGNIKLELNKPEEALTYYQMARANADNVLISAITFIRLAEVFLRMGNLDQAYLTAQQLQKLFILEDLNGIGDYVYGAISFQTGNYQDAAFRFQDLVERYTNSPFSLPAVTMALVAMARNGEWDRALTFGNLMRSEFEGATSRWGDWFRLELAEANYYQDNYSIAEGLYTQVSQNAQERLLITRANVGLGWCYVHENRNEEAIALLNAMATLGAAASDTNLIIAAYYGMGVAKFNEGKYRDAYADFAAVVKTFPEAHDVLPDLLYFQGLAASALRSYGDALVAWEKVVSTYPDHPRAADAAYRAADIYRRAGKYDKSNTLLTWLLEHFPGHHLAAQAQYMLAQNYYNLHQYRKAIEEFEKFLSLYPESDLASQAKELMQYAYYRLSEEDPQALQEFLNKFPTSELAAEAEYARAVDLFQAGQQEEAANAFLTFAVNHPKNDKAPVALLVAGQILYKLKKYPDAIVPLKKYLSFFGDRPGADTAAYFLGLAYFKAQQYRDAIAVLQPLSEKEGPFRDKAITFIASAYEELGELKKAVQYYTLAGDEMARKGQADQAIQFYQYAYKLAPDPAIKQQLEQKIRSLSGASQGQQGQGG